MRAGFGYEFLERPDGFRGWSQLYGLHFAAPPSVIMDLGLIYRALVDKKVDIVAGNSTDGLIEALHLVPLVDDKHYFPPYDAVPIVRRDALRKFPTAPLPALADLANKISAQEMRHLNSEVDANQREPCRCSPRLPRLQVPLTVVHSHFWLCSYDPHVCSHPGRRDVDSVRQGNSL